MENLSRSTVLFLLFCIVVLLQFELAFQDAGQQNVAQNEPEHPFLPKFVMDSISLFKRSHKSSWEKIKAVVHDLQTQFSPPNLEGGKEGKDGLKGTVKEAAEKSFDKSKETAKESAKSAAKAVGGAVQMGAKKVKKGSSSDPDSKDEL